MCIRDRVSTQSTGKDHQVGMAERTEDIPLISHNIKGHGKLLGCVAITTILGCMVFGPMSPFVVAALVWNGWYAAAIGLATFLAIPFVVQLPPSSGLGRFYLLAAGWFNSGVTLHIENRAVDLIGSEASMWCMHPHGTSIGLGFTLNGAIRFKALQPNKFVPGELSSRVSPERLSKISGIQAMRSLPPTSFYCRHLHFSVCH
eukprot:TRINITY_DN13238_c0_g1_i3.p1 TRINITY_DN13238_c0_g1~~TRINITY_DN13238_c0_g1_i3.p1  ORF type:complete len:202 (+),score=42.04 TRINITY_DN13238_c0_g1_i3:156-761(+)